MLFRSANLLQLFVDGFQLRLNLPVAEKIDLLVREVNSGFDIRPERRQCFNEGMYVAGKFTLQGTRGGAGRLFGITVDEVGNRLGLGQVELVVEEGTLGKLPGRATRAPSAST